MGGGASNRSDFNHTDLFGTKRGASKWSDFNHTDLFGTKRGASKRSDFNHTDLFSKKGGAQVRDLILIRFAYSTTHSENIVKI